jgi:hypothetical protein
VLAKDAQLKLSQMKLEEIMWDRSVKEAVWKKGRINPDYSPEVLRWDDQGHIMMWSKFGRTDSAFGWTIMANEPLTKGGLDNIENLQPVSLRSRRKGP